MRCLSVHITDLCNSRCSFCVVGSPLYARDTIKYENIVAFVKSNAGNGYSAVNLHGGEPTIHPRFFELLSLIQSLGYSEVHLQTNGIRLADRGFAQKAVDLGVRLFIVSLHGDDPATQDCQTGTPNGFVRTLEGLRNASGAGARVRTNTVVTRQNLGRLSGISQTAIDHGAHHLNFSNLHPVGSAIFGLSRMAPTFTEVRPHLFEAVEVGLRQGRRVTLEGFPYCTVKEYADYHLNNEYRDIRMMYRDLVFDYDSFMSDEMRRYGPPCEKCAVRKRCGRVYKEYVDLRGWEEFSPLSVDAAFATPGI